jgi:TRAP-type C4-dicarboxylate transport system substrate-binding protein
VRLIRKLNLLAQLLLSSFTNQALANDIVIKMGTIAPDGSPWHQILLDMGEKWRKISGGKVKLIVYAGTLGDEPNLVDKLRIRQLQAAALSAGLSEVEQSVNCLEIPMMFQSYEELDYVRERITPRLEKMIEQKGYVVVNWGDVGWVHFFSKTPVVHLNDIRKLKLFTWAGDDEELQLWRANGFKPVALAATDILPGLQTGLIEAVPSAPLYALFNQFFGVARNMSDVKWAPLIGATIVSKTTWDLIPAAERAPLLEAARESGEALRGGIRKMGDDAVIAMQKRGLKVVHADDAAVADWRKEAEAVYPKLRGKMVPADLFDQVQALRDEYRASASSGGKA